MNCVESTSTPVGHAVTSLPPSHATQGGSTHVHDPQGSDSVLWSTTQSGRTPLVTAARWGYNDIVQELLKHGASVNIQDRVSQRPCMFPHLCKVLHSVLFWLLVCTQIVEDLWSSIVVHYTQTLLYDMMCIAHYGLKWTELLSTCTHTYVFLHATEHGCT